MATSSRISTLYRPGLSSFVFSISSTEESLDEETIRTCYQLVTSLLVSLTTEQSSLRTSNGRQGEMREPTRTMEQETIQGLRIIIRDGGVRLESQRVASLA
jgi:hypothetical protein